MVKFGLWVAAGALLVGAAGFGADAALSTEGWWFWGLCAGAIGGALFNYAGEQVEAKGKG
jgi:hypothetical protein